MGSTRLPGKVLKKVGDKSLLELLINRLNKATSVSQIIIATSDSKSDDDIETECKRLNTSFIRGSEHDVLSRFYHASKKYSADHYVRITADCPLMDWEIIDSVVQAHLIGKNDYTSNINPPTFPDGMDVEVFSKETLLATFKKARLPSEREHVTPYMRKPENGFKTGNFLNKEDQSGFRITVDTDEDFLLIKNIFNYFENISMDNFKLIDIIRLLKEDDELLRINDMYSRNEGSLKSKQEDELFLKDKK